MLDGMSVAAVVIGAVLMIFGLNAFDGVHAQGLGLVGSARGDAPVWLLLSGAIAVVLGLMGLVLGSKTLDRGLR